jgi:hypothetical protein
VWRRPHTLIRVLDAIRPLAPTCLFVACDGPSPSRPGEAQKVAETRRLIEQEINWPCQIERLYSDENKGCREGVSRAISWFFEQVDEGIILEDDCVPHPDFFSYCTALLERFRHDTRVWSICGSNFQLGNKRGDASYYFSIYADPWGWATWKRAWSSYSKADKIWNQLKGHDYWQKKLFSSPEETSYWNLIFEKLFNEGIPNTWDYRWFIVCWSEHALHAWPNAPLVTNCGFDSDATHTFGRNPFSATNLNGLGHIYHPQLVLPSHEADAFAYIHRFSGFDRNQKTKRSLILVWLSKLKRARAPQARAVIARLCQGFVRFLKSWRQ